jgi:hypothetical protein
LVHSRVNSNGIRPDDFSVAEIARQELQRAVESFKKETKLEWRQRLGVKTKSAKDKSVDLLEQSTATNFNELKSIVDKLEDDWKKNNGVVR